MQRKEDTAWSAITDKILTEHVWFVCLLFDFFFTIRALPEDEEQSGEEYEEVERPKRHAVSFSSTDWHCGKTLMVLIYLNYVAFLSTIQRNRGRNLPPLSPTPMSPTPTSSGNFSNNDQTSSSFIVSAPSKSADIYPEIEMLTRKMNHVLALFLLYHYLGETNVE